MIVLLTGGTGFVGREVLPTLLQAGHTVRALARPGSVAKIPRHERCAPIEGNPLDPESLARALDGCDAAVHLIGTRRSEIKATGQGYDEVDAGSARAMVAAMNRCGVRRILLLSAAIIGGSRYVQTKEKTESIVRNAELAWTIYRPSFILGPGQQWPVVMEPILALFGLVPGHLGDVARRARGVTRKKLAQSMAWALDHPESIGKIYDVPAIRALDV